MSAMRLFLSDYGQGKVENRYICHELQTAAENGIPVIIMEPLRGGKLVDLLPEKAKKIIAENPRKRIAIYLNYPVVLSRHRIEEIDVYGVSVSEITIPENAVVVGLGEASHGNVEFQELKLILFQKLVKRANGITSAVLFYMAIK